MKKAIISIYEKYSDGFYNDDIYDTKTICMILDRKNYSDKRFINVLADINLNNRLITIDDLYGALLAFDYSIEESKELQSNRDFKFEYTKINKLKCKTIYGNKTKVLIYIDRLHNNKAKNDALDAYTYLPYIKQAEKNTKKVTISLLDKHLGLCISGINDTKAIKLRFDKYDKDINNIVKIFHRYNSSNKITINNIYDILKAYDYILEEDELLKSNPEFKSKEIKVNQVKSCLINNGGFKVLLYVDSFQTDINPDIERYLINDMVNTYNLCDYFQRELGKAQATNSFYVVNPKYDYKLFEDYFNKLKGGENNMKSYYLTKPKRVICSGPVTTVIYDDGTKTHVRKMKEDQNDYEKAFLLSWLYKTYGKKAVNQKLDEFKDEFSKEEANTNSKENPLFSFSVKEVSERLNKALENK